MKQWMIAALALVATGLPAHAQFSSCASIANPAARLECYDRGGASAGRSAQAAPPRAAAPLVGSSDGSCTRSNPCVGPRGGVYYFTSGGRKQYLPR